MRKRKYVINFLAAVALLASCSESLKDTYSDFAGDGKIRYTAKCSELYVTPGWERLIINWVNGVDATVDKIKVVWTFDGRKDSVLLPNTATSFELKDLKDGTYRFDVCAVDGRGKESLREITYGRPYTREHEIMRAFTRGVLKPYFLKNKMIFFSDRWNKNIVEMKLKYKNTNGETRFYEFTRGKDEFGNDSSYNTLVTIPDVSMEPRDTIYVIRQGKLDDSPDVIVFDPLVVSRKKNFSGGFVNAITKRYGYSIETKEEEAKFEEFIEKVEELEFDYDMETFEDVLYCPNLKKLVFGKNRYLIDGNPGNSLYDRSILMGSEEKNTLVLNLANKPDILGLTIDVYGNNRFIHYFKYRLPYMTHKGFPQLPPMDFIQREELKSLSDTNKITCAPKDPYAIPDNLLDNNPKSRWSVTAKGNLREHFLMMEFLEETKISGVKITQVYYDPMSEPQTPNLMPTAISMQTSTDGATWKNVTFFEKNELGLGVGEITLLQIPKEEGSRRVRYIKFSVRDRIDAETFSIRLGDVIPYKLKN